MASKIRTQVQLERRQYERLKALAYQRRESLSEVVRSLLDQVLDGEAGDPSAVREARLGFVGAGRDAASDVARRHDEYRYGGGR